MSNTTSHIETIRKKARHLLNAIHFADPPKEFNEVLCHEARIPVAFVIDFERALASLEALSRQPVQTEDLEAVEQHAVEWWNLESTRQLFPDPVPNPIGMATDFYRFMQARSLSEPKSQGFTPTNTTDNG